MKIRIFTALVFCFICSFCYADTLILKNGTRLEGRILEDDLEEVVKLEVVHEGKLIGAVIEIGRGEIKEMVKNFDYNDLRRDNLTDEEIQRNLELYEKRLKDSHEYNKGEWDRIYKLKVLCQERELRYAQFEYELKKIQLEHENRKDLIKFSKKNLVSPIIRIIDINDRQSEGKSIKDMLKEY